MRRERGVFIEVAMGEKTRVSRSRISAEASGAPSNPMPPAIRRFPFCRRTIVACRRRGVVRHRSSSWNCPFAGSKISAQPAVSLYFEVGEDGLPGARHSRVERVHIAANLRHAQYDVLNQLKMQIEKEVLKDLGLFDEDKPKDKKP